MKEKHFEDDGRVIADMGAVEKPRYASLWIGGKASQSLIEGRSAQMQERKHAPHGDAMDAGEQRAAVFGALGAALLIGLIFIAAAGLLILGLLLLWKQ